MIVLVPVSRFKVPYDTARGRPYSPLEALVLENIAGRGATLTDLQATFRVHERLLVESVVTLITAGWVAVAGGPHARFVLTAAGDAAARGDSEPVSVVVSPAKPQTVVMERVTGQVARHYDARSWSRRDLGDDTWEHAAIMRERIIRNSLDEAQVQKLLQHETGHWIRRIGPIRLSSRGTHYVAVEADPTTGQVRGMPRAWHESLTAKVLDCARAKSSSPTQTPDAPIQRPTAARGRQFRLAGGADARQPAARATPFQISERDLLVGESAHDAVLGFALDNARTSVAIVAPTVRDIEEYRQMVNRAAQAVARGIAVDLLVGEMTGLSAADLVAIANAAGYKADARDGRRRLRVRNASTGSGASLLVHDAGPAVLTAVVGNHEWIGLNGPSSSIQVSEPSLAADVARAVASLWTGRDWTAVEWAGAADRWRRLASKAEEAGALAHTRRPTHDPEHTVFGELLVDDEHAGLITTTRAALIGGHRPDPNSGEAAMRGVTLRVTGNLIAIKRASG